MRVTEALKLLGFIDDVFYTEEGAQKGSVLHELTQFDDEGDLDEGSVDPLVASKLEGWRKFVRENRPKILENEVKLEYEPLGMTGTPDRLVEMSGALWILDIKSGARAGWHRWQVALYSLLWSLKNGKTAPKRCVVYLLENDYRLDRFEDRRDVERAKALVTAAFIRKEAS